MIAGPVSPPRNTAARESSRSPPCCFVGPWHPMQLATSSGRTFFSKNSRFAGVLTDSAADAAGPPALSAAQVKRATRHTPSQTPTDTTTKVGPHERRRRGARGIVSGPEARGWLQVSEEGILRHDP